MLGRVFICLWLAAGAAAAGEGLFDDSWSEDFASAAAWRAMPGWLANASPDAKLETADGVACFTVPEKGRGMKWRRAADAYVPSTPFLVVRCRAQGVQPSDDYFLYIDDRGKKETRPILLRDLRNDGRWRTLAVDLRLVAESDAVRAIAVQVQAAAAPARVWVDFIRFCAAPPAGAVLLNARSLGPAAPDLWLDLSKAEWTPQPSWLSNPSPAADVERADGQTVFRVRAAHAGMKWSWFFDQPVSLKGRRYVCLRYRSAGTRPYSDYAACVLGTKAADGKSYFPIIRAQRLRHNGRWHTLTLPIDEAAALFPTIKGLAIQVQCDAGGDALFAVSKLGFVNHIAPASAQDLLAAKPVESTAGFALLPPPADANADLQEALDAMNVQGWPFGRRVAVDGVPFQLPAKGRPAPASGLRATGSLVQPVGKRCSQVFLLTLAVLRGKEEEVYARNARCTRIAEIDRFRAALDYADGSRDECFPYNATSRDYSVSEGAQVLCVFADPTKRLERVTLEDRTDRAGFVVVAATARAAGRLFADAAEENLPTLIRPRRPPARPVAAPVIKPSGDGFALDCGVLRARLAVRPAPRLVSLRNNYPVSDELFKHGPGAALYEVRVDGKPASWSAFALQDAELETPQCLRLAYDAASLHVRFTLRVETVMDREIAFRASLTNTDSKTRRLGLAGPVFGDFVLGRRLAANYYVFPKRGWLFHNRPVSARARYGGMFPLQFVAAFNPAAGSCAWLRTEDLAGVLRDYRLDKTEAGLRFWLDYPAREIQPGASLTAARSLIGAYDGDWRDAFNRYSAWVKTWYRPQGPRPRWWRETFNFRQRFLHNWDPLYDAKTGRFRLEDALAEARRCFGGMEYLHLFDWGNCGRYGRIYGRVGDYSPYDYLKGGRAAFRAAIAGVQRRGVHVGLYIEGYLLQERGKLGRKFGKQWQLIDWRGRPRYWPGSTEMMMCPWVKGWREVQAATYAAKVKELDVDGMYLDEFGFAGSGKDCWSRRHGHPVPGYAVLGERGLSQLVRRRITAVKPAVVLYDEETPCDVNSQILDGSFTYHMRCCRQSQPLAPLHPLRFAVPSFKTFEILVCDRPTGSWAEGVKWAFFNGEGLWLEGPGREWFRADTLAVIRKCHAILRRWRSAFASDSVEALVPTLAPGVFANRFVGDGVVVYTLYNARHRTTRGPVLALPGREAGRVYDAWNDRPLAAPLRGGRRVVSLTLGPRDVGCVVCER